SRQTLILFPKDENETLTREFFENDPRPVTLIVPDGNWGQASRMSRRLPGTEHARHVKLPEGPKTRYRLRHEPRTEGLATMEAIARAFGIIESRDAERHIQHIFEAMVAASLQAKP
ncbi:MAG: DTW domain-containing protein, partial [Myxococcales bacterium]|nr:DTW domain-containing protein [Myxococcales bacterium]